MNKISQNPFLSGASIWTVTNSTVKLQHRRLTVTPTEWPKCGAAQAISEELRASVVGPSVSMLRRRPRLLYTTQSFGKHGYLQIQLHYILLMVQFLHPGLLRLHGQKLNYKALDHQEQSLDPETFECTDCDGNSPSRWCTKDYTTACIC